MSAVQEISAGIIQGSAIGPASFVVNSGDLKAITHRNGMCKYADDTYLIIPSANEGSRIRLSLRTLSPGRRITT